jgi:hypothetical protein
MTGKTLTAWSDAQSVKGIAGELSAAVENVHEVIDSDAVAEPTLGATKD